MGLLAFLGFSTEKKRAELKPNGKDEPVRRKKRRTTLVKVDELLAAEEQAEEIDEVEVAMNEMKKIRTATMNQFTQSFSELDDELKEQLRKSMDNSPGLI